MRTPVPHDLLISGGSIVDPEAGSIEPADVAVHGGRISAIGPAGSLGAGERVLDAAGLLVTPGLIDLHSHVYWRGSPLSVDVTALAPGSGVTTWVDAGSAYATTIEGLREWVIDRAPVRVLAFLRIGHGTNEIVPTSELAATDPGLLAAVAARHRDVVVGVKVSLGQSTLEPLRAAIEAAEAAGLPVMMHIAQAPPDVNAALAMLRPGDIVTHALTGQTMRLIDDGGSILPAAAAARDRGVWFDVGHGAGSFSWRTGEAMAAAGFWPQTISTDAWQVSVRGPMFDLATCASKLLHLGLPLLDVLRAVTSVPATILGRPDLGALRVGGPADIAGLRVVDGAFPLYDSAQEARVASRLIRPVLTIAAGRVLERAEQQPLADWLDIALGMDGMDPNPQGGLRPVVRAFHAELVRRGHTPAQMAPAEMAPPEATLSP